MSRYIDADKYIEHKKQVCKKCQYACETEVSVCLIKKQMDEINDRPTEDVVPVVHAHWTDCNGKYVWVNSYVSPTSLGLYCSHCHEELIASDEYSVAGRYCPSCGAKMDEDIPEDIPMEYFENGGN